MPTEAEVKKLSIEIRDAWWNAEGLPEDDAWKAVARHVLSQGGACPQDEQELSDIIYDFWVESEFKGGDWSRQAARAIISRYGSLPSLDDIPTQFLARAMWRAVWPEHEFPEEILGVWDKAAERLKAWVRKQRS